MCEGDLASLIRVRVHSANFIVESMAWRTEKEKESVDSNFCTCRSKYFIENKVESNERYDEWHTIWCVCQTKTVIDPNPLYQ